jgi:hypothetical protein
MDQGVNVESGAEPSVVWISNKGESCDIEKHLKDNQEYVKSDSWALPAVGVDARMVSMLSDEKVVGHFVSHDRT